MRLANAIMRAIYKGMFPFTYDPLNAFLRHFDKKLPIGMWGWSHKRLYTEEQVKDLLSSEGFKIKKFERGSHAFIALFVNYIPFIITHVFSPIFKKAQEKKEIRELPRIIRILNGIDKKYFANTNSIELYFVAEKE